MCILECIIENNGIKKYFVEFGINIEKAAFRVSSFTFLAL